MGLSLPGGRFIRLDHPVIMGILNVTPDSFSDGGEWVDPDAAAQHGLAMAQAGATIIDVGGESTRPGSQRVAAPEQLRRVIPAIERLKLALEPTHPDVAISIDTTLASVARTAIEAGASILNDISAGQEDEQKFDIAAEHGAPLVLMHMQGTPQIMQKDPRYDDVVANVQAFLLARAQVAISRGVRPDQIIIDPGIGFGKTLRHNLALLANLDRFVATPYPVLLGASRKRFMGAICQNADGNAPRPQELVETTCATTALGVAAGVAIFRVHDVRANRRAANVARAIVNARSAQGPALGAVSTKSASDPRD